jgi:integral membrane protein (TIGR01906 family)
MSESVFQETASSKKTGIFFVIVWLMQICLVLMIPALLVIGGARLIMTPFFLQMEYTRAGFPEDGYGFSTEDRLEYGSYGILYILNNKPVEYLAELRLDGSLCFPLKDTSCAAFNPGELSHMEDVQVVAHGVFSFGLFAGMLAMVLMLILWRFISIEALRLALMQASFLTLGLIVTIIFLAMTAWDSFFGGFHSIFFEEGTWQFFYSDTLIRLYPQQFWFDASLVVGGLTTLGAIIILFISLRLGHEQ